VKWTNPTVPGRSRVSFPSPLGEDAFASSWPGLRLLGIRVDEARGACWDVDIAGREPLLRDCRYREDPDGEQDDAARPHGSPGSELTNAATAVPTASIGRDPDETSLLYVSCARLSRSRPLLVATAYTATARAAIFRSRFTPGSVVPSAHVPAGARFARSCASRSRWAARSAEHRRPLWDYHSLECRNRRSVNGFQSARGRVSLRRRPLVTGCASLAYGSVWSSGSS
jgi:hypothetical protein